MFRENENSLLLLKQAHAFVFHFSLSSYLLFCLERISQPSLLYQMSEKTNWYAQSERYWHNFGHRDFNHALCTVHHCGGAQVLRYSSIYPPLFL